MDHMNTPTTKRWIKHVHTLYTGNFMYRLSAVANSSTGSAQSLIAPCAQKRYIKAKPVIHGLCIKACPSEKSVVCTVRPHREGGPRPEPKTVSPPLTATSPLADRACSVWARWLGVTSQHIPSPAEGEHHGGGHTWLLWPGLTPPSRWPLPRAAHLLSIAKAWQASQVCEARVVRWKAAYGSHATTLFWPRIPLDTSLDTGTCLHKISGV